MKKFVYLLVAITVFSLSKTYSLLDDYEKNNNELIAGEIDLEINGKNLYGEAIIEKNISCKIYHENVTLHLTQNSLKAKAKICFFNVSGQSAKISISIKNSSGHEFVLIDNVTSKSLNNTCINLTGNGVYLIPCINYTLEISFYLVNETKISFDIEFFTGEKSFYDVERSKNNFILIK